MKLIDTWRSDWKRLWSPQLAIACAFVEIANQVVTEIAGVLPYRWLSITAAILAILAALARFVKQPDAKPTADQ